MPHVKVYKFTAIFEVEHFLNGGLIGGSVTTGVLGLVGKTITFETPAFSHTFLTEGNPDDRLLFKDIREQLEDASPLIKVIQFGGKIGFIEATPTTGVVLAADTTGGHAVTVGTVDLSTLDYGGGGDLDTDTLTLNVNDTGDQVITFTAPANQNDVIDQINAVVSPDLVASIDADNHLRLETVLTGDTASIEVVSGTGGSVDDLGLVVDTYTGASLNDANTYLGFDRNEATEGKVYGSPYDSDLSPPYFLESYSINESTHVVYTYEN